MSNTTKTHKIVRVTGEGGSEALRVQEELISEPGEREVRIKVEAIGLNRAENLYHQGYYLYKPKIGSPIGYEAVGVKAVKDSIDKYVHLRSNPTREIK